MVISGAKRISHWANDRNACSGGCEVSRPLSGPRDPLFRPAGLAQTTQDMNLGQETNAP